LKEAQMRRQIVQGSNVMPAFGDILNESELADLLSYLRACRDKKKTPPNTP
jgi:mono/diheme cytochrome c family protein